MEIPSGGFNVADFLQKIDSIEDSRISAIDDALKRRTERKKKPALMGRFKTVAKLLNSAWPTWDSQHYDTFEKEIVEFVPEKEKKSGVRAEGVTEEEWRRRVLVRKAVRKNGSSHGSVLLASDSKDTSPILYMFLIHHPSPLHQPA